MTSKNEIAKNFTLSMLDALREEIVNDRTCSHEYIFFKDCLMNGLKYFEETGVVERTYVMPHVTVNGEELKGKFPDNAV